MNKINPVILLVGFVAFMCVLFYYKLSTGKDLATELHSYGETTSGIVVDEYKGIEYGYVVHGKEYFKSQRAKPRGLVDGEVFQVLYDKKSPNVSLIDFTIPLFDTINYDKTCIRGYQVINGNGKGLVKYDYDYNGETFTRYQKVNYSSIDNGSPFTVWVNRKRPRQSYLVSGECFSPNE